MAFGRRPHPENPSDYSIDWSWKARSGRYPDQFRRDRFVRLDATSDSGYSGWDQLADGAIVIADYTNDAFAKASSPDAPKTVVKAYVDDESQLR